MMIGCVQPGTRRGTFLQMIGSRKIVPPRMLRIVPFGERHISLRPNSFTRPSSGVMVAHFTATPTSRVLFAASIGDLVVGLVALLDREIEIDEVEVEIGVDQLVLDELPDDPGHLVAVHLDDGIGHLDLRHVREPPFESTQPGSRCTIRSTSLRRMLRQQHRLNDRNTCSQNCYSSDRALRLTQLEFGRNRAKFRAFAPVAARSAPQLQTTARRN